MAIQNHLFGSPFSTGYGAARRCSRSRMSRPTSPSSRARAGTRPGTVMDPRTHRRPDRGAARAAIDTRARRLRGVMLPYLFYLPFDHWETLRFLLPGIVPLTVLSADGLMHFARMPRRPAAAAAVVIGVHGALPSRNPSSAATVERVGHGVARGALSARRRVGQRQHAANSVVHGESAQRLAAVVRQASDAAVGLHRAGRPRDNGPRAAITRRNGYVALEGDEVEMFERGSRT